MQFEKKPFKSGDSLAIILPKYHTLFLGIDKNTPIIIEDEEDHLLIRKKGVQDEKQQDNN